MKFLAYLFASFLVFSTTQAFAETQSEDDSATTLDEVMGSTEIVYYEIKPDFTTTLSGRGAGGRLHYLRVTVILMLSDSNLVGEVKKREPLIRDAVITTIGSKHFKQLVSAEGREMLRTECRDKVATILEDKLGKHVVNDLLFTTYLYQ